MAPLVLVKRMKFFPIIQATFWVLSMSFSPYEYYTIIRFLLVPVCATAYMIIFLKMRPFAIDHLKYRLGLSGGKLASSNVPLSLSISAAETSKRRGSRVTKRNPTAALAQQSTRSSFFDSWKLRESAVELIVAEDEEDCNNMEEDELAALIDNNNNNNNNTATNQEDRASNNGGNTVDAFANL